MDPCRDAKPSPVLAIPSVPDISGSGVLISFIAPAYVLLIIVIFHYVVTYQPELDQFRSTEEPFKRCVRPNPFDQWALRNARKVLWITPPEVRRKQLSWRLQRAFDKCVLAMADIQLFTGFAILLAAYVSRYTLATLHWNLAVYLAWFSCATHLSALVFLRNYLFNHQTQRLWRLLAMFALLVVLIVALVPTGHFHWEDALLYSDEIFYFNRSSGIPPSANAACYLNANFEPESQRSKNSMLASVIILLVGFLTRLFKVQRAFFGLKTESVHFFIIRKLLDSALFFQRILGKSRIEERVVSNISTSAHLVVCIWVDILTSTALEVYWLIISLAWGTLRIVDLLTVLRRSDVDQDGTWSFGQVLPVVLLAGPFTNVLEHFLKSFLSDDKSRKKLFDPIILPTAPLDQSLTDYTTNPSVSSTTSHLTTESSDRTWILRPELYDCYLRGTIWMSWIQVIYGGNIILITIAFLQRSFIQSNTSLGLSYAVEDPFHKARSLILWSTVGHGANAQVFILALSLMEAKWSHRVIHIPMLVISGCYISLSFFTVAMVPPRGDSLGFIEYIIPSISVGITLTLFLIALAIKLGARVLRVWRRRK